MEENNITTNNNTELLNDVYKNIKTGLQTINLLTNKIFSQSLKEFIAEQYADYDLILQKIKDKSKETDVTLKDLNWFKKAQMWTSINMNTLLNESTDHIAQMLILGSVMGAVDMIRAIDNSPNADEIVIKIAYDTKNMQEKHGEELKKYLTKSPEKYSKNYKTEQKNESDKQSTDNSNKQEKTSENEKKSKKQNDTKKSKSSSKKS